MGYRTVEDIDVSQNDFQTMLDELTDAKNSLVQHNGYMPRQWVFGLIPHLRTKLRVLNTADAASDMHIAILNLIVRRWDRWKTMTGICDIWENFRQCLMS